MDMIVRKCIDHFYGRVLAFCRMLYSLKVSFNGSDTRVSVSFYQCYQLVNSNGKQQKKTECIELHLWQLMATGNNKQLSYNISFSCQSLRSDNIPFYSSVVLFARIFLFVGGFFFLVHSIQWKPHYYQATSCIHSHLFIDVICAGNFPNQFFRTASVVHCSQCTESYFVFG